MNILIILSIMAWVGTAITQGLSLITIGSIVSTGLFCSRKIGHFCKLSTLLIIEGISLFITVAWQLLFNSFSWPRFIICIILRIVFLWICYYDMTQFTYVKEIHRKE